MPMYYVDGRGAGWFVIEAETKAHASQAAREEFGGFKPSVRKATDEEVKHYRDIKGQIEKLRL